MGGFRWILSPYVGMTSAFAVLAWEKHIELPCVDSAAINSFIDDHYNKAPENVPSDGWYTDLYKGKCVAPCNNEAKPCGGADINGDGEVNSSDLLVLIASYYCETSASETCG